METEAQLIMQRASLRWLAQQHPTWTQQELAITVGKSLAWVKKWLKRLREAKPTDVMVLHARSRERLTPPASITSQTAGVQRILEIGESPPENLHRVGGPEAILYSVHRDPELRKAGVRLPRSQTTSCKILRLFGCIAQDHRRKPRPLERKQPGEEIQLDLKDATTVPADAEGKRKPGGGNDQFRGCGHLHLAKPQRWGRLRRSNEARKWWRSFYASMACPPCSPLTMMRALWAAPVDAISPPPWCGFCCVWVSSPMCARRIVPRLHAFVERFHRTLGEECLRVQWPQTLEQVQEASENFLHHYNDERPNQARSCGNQPPCVACPIFPTFPAVPETIDADRWLERLNGQVLVRKVQSDASLTINHERYDVPRELAGKLLACLITAPEKQFDIWQAGLRVKSVPIKGLSSRTVPFEEYVELMKQEARSEYRQDLQTHPTLTQGRLWA